MPRLWSGVAKSGNRPWVRAAALSRAVRGGLRALVVSAIPAPGVWPWPDHRGWFRRLAGDLPLPKRDCQFGEHDGEVGDRRENAKLSHPLWVSSWAVPAGQRRGRSTSISGLPSREPEPAYLAILIRRPDDDVLDLLSWRIQARLQTRCAANHLTAERAVSAE